MMMDSSDASAGSGEDRDRAAELYALAREQEARREYDAALRSYAASLRLCDDEDVKAAYFRLMATVWPQ